MSDGRQWGSCDGGIEVSFRQMTRRSGGEEDDIKEEKNSALNAGRLCGLLLISGQLRSVFLEMPSLVGGTFEEVLER